MDEPPTEAELAQSVPPTTATSVPATPVAQVAGSEPAMLPPHQASEVAEPAPKRRRIGRNTSEVNLPENVLGDDSIKTAFASFINKCVSATAEAKAYIEHEDSIAAELDDYMRSTLGTTTGRTT